MSAPRVVTACGDPGGANAIAPVLEQLVADGRVQLNSFAYHQATVVLSRHGLAFEEIPRDAGSDWVARCLRECSLLFTATSHNGTDYEKRLIAEAQRQGVPSLAVLDFWSNQRERFAAADGVLRYVPDTIAVMDDHARAALLELGIPAAAVLVTGQPAFDSLPARRAAFDVAARSAVRAATGTTDDEVQVLFASQPLLRLYGRGDAEGGLGYDENSVLDVLVAALEDVARRRALAITLVIRPHPREAAKDHAQRPSGLVRIVVAGEGNQYDAAMAADIVVGMTSILLVEAAYLGCPVLSLQPNARTPNMLPVDRGVSLPVVTTPALVQEALEATLSRTGASVQAAGHIDGVTATERVVRCIYLKLGITEHRQHERQH